MDNQHIVSIGYQQKSLDLWQTAHDLTAIPTPLLDGRTDEMIYPVQLFEFYGT
jgi:hypothetical protein